MSDIHSFEPFWNDWYIIDELGSGAYGTVYRAKKRGFGECYSAIKHIPIPGRIATVEALLDEGVISSPREVEAYYAEMLRSILREIDIIKQLKGQANIVSYEEHRIVERKDAPGYDLFVRMELLTSLTEYMKTHPLSVRDVILLGIDVCTALSLLMDNQIIHRDIKPANIFVNDAGNFKLGDFGVARFMDRGVSTVSIKGNIAHMAPEVLKGQDVGRSADTYSLGLVMYKLLNHNRPAFVPPPPTRVYPDEARLAQYRRVYGGEKLPPPALCPEGLSEIVLRACAYRPEDRWRSPDEMKLALTEQLFTMSDDALSRVVLGGSETPTELTGGTGADDPEQTVFLQRSRAARARRSRTRRTRRGALIAAVAVCVLLILALCMGCREKKAPEPKAAVIEQTGVGTDAPGADEAEPPTEEPAPEPESEPEPEPEPVRQEPPPAPPDDGQPSASAPPEAEDTPTPAPSVVEVSGVALSRSNAMLEPGGSLRLSASVTPSDATDASIQWSSSNAAVATVNGGLVTATGEGTAVITATSGNGVSASCVVSVI